VALTKPCSVCRKWFEPSPRAVRHQKTCGADCRKALHRRRCKEWRQRNPDYDRAHRLANAVVPEPDAPLPADPLRLVDWDKARAAIGVCAQVVIAEVAKVSIRAARDAVTQEVKVLRGELSRVPRQPARDAVRSGNTYKPELSPRVPLDVARDGIGPGGSDP